VVETAAFCVVAQCKPLGGCQIFGGSAASDFGNVSLKLSERWTGNCETLARTLEPHLTISWFSMTPSYLSACLHNLTTSQPS